MVFLVTFPCLSRESHLCPLWAKIYRFLACCASKPTLSRIGNLLQACLPCCASKPTLPILESCWRLVYPAVLGKQASQPCLFSTTCLSLPLSGQAILRFIVYEGQDCLYINHNSFYLFFHPETSIHDPKLIDIFFYANGMILSPMAKKAKHKSNLSPTHFHLLQ